MFLMIIMPELWKVENLNNNATTVEIIIENFDEEMPLQLN